MYPFVFSIVIASTEGYQKGAVAEARAALEQKYQLLRQMQNVASIYEGDTEYRPFLLAINAEVEHFNQILNRKGKGNSGDNPSAPSDPGTGDNTGGTDTPGTDTPGTDTPGTGDNTGDNTGGGTGTITPSGGDNGGTDTPPSGGDPSSDEG